MMHDGVLSITRRIKHLGPWTSLQRLGRELTTVHAPGMITSVNSRSMRSAPSIIASPSAALLAAGVVPETADLRHDVFADQRVVLDNQDGFLRRSQIHGSSPTETLLRRSRSTSAGVRVGLQPRGRLLISSSP